MGEVYRFSLAFHGTGRLGDHLSLSRGSSGTSLRVYHRLPIPAAAQERKRTDATQNRGTRFRDRVQSVAIEVDFITRSSEDDVGRRVSGDPVGSEQGIGIVPYRRVALDENPSTRRAERDHL